MPMIKSASPRATEENFDEFRHGKTFKKTSRKFGRKKARKQMIAAVLNNKRKAAAKQKKHRSSGR
jgi:hypothetical protein